MQKRAFRHIPNSLDGLKEAAREIISDEGLEAHSILREIEKAEIQAHSNRSYSRTGQRLPKKLKKRLSKEYNYSEKEIENIVYRSFTN